MILSKHKLIKLKLINYSQYLIIEGMMYIIDYSKIRR